MRKLGYPMWGSFLLLCSIANSSPDLSWTKSCVRVTSVANYTAYSKEFVVTLSSGPTGCNGEISGVAGAIPFSVGKNGVSDANFATLLDTALAAYTSGHQVTIGYDKGTPSCFGAVIVLGGLQGECP